MTIDLAVLAVLFFAGGLGLWSGAIRQVAHLGGLIAGWFAARPLAQLLGPLAAKQFGYPLLVTTIGCSFACFFVVYVVSVFALRFLLARFLPDGERGTLNRLGGFVLGAAKAAILVFVALSLVVFAEKFLLKLWPGFKKEADPSLSIRLARHHGLFASLPAVGGLEKILNASRDPQAAAKLAEDPDFQALSRDPRVRGMVDDQGIRRALQDGDVASLLGSVRVLDALNDPKFMERLTRFDSGGAPEPTPARPAATRPAKPAEKAPAPGATAPDAAVLEGPRH